MQITEEASERSTEFTDKMLIALVLVNKNNRQTGLLKNMVPDPRWFSGNRIKFEDWWKGMRLFLKSNRVMETDNKITILACLRGGVAGIYTQKKLNELDKETGI